MPKGNPSKQTVATEKYAKKVGLISKSYKLKRELTEEFADACAKRNTSASAELSRFMEKFIEETKKMA